MQRLGQPCRRFAHFCIAYEAALAGEGLVVAPTVLASADVAAGRLVAPWPTITVPGAPCTIVMPATAAMRRQSAVIVRAGHRARRSHHERRHISVNEASSACPSRRSILPPTP